MLLLMAPPLYHYVNFSNNFSTKSLQFYIFRKVYSIVYVLDGGCYFVLAYIEVYGGSAFNLVKSPSFVKYGFL